MNLFFIFSAEYLFIATIIILGAYFIHQPRASWLRLALFAVPAGLLTWILGLIANHIYVDPRPFVVDHFIPLISHTSDNGFPSDHTLLAAAFAAVGMYWNKWLGIVLWIITGIIAVARVYVGVHHPLDVLASILFALIAVSAWHWILARRTKNKMRHSF